MAQGRHDTPAPGEAVPHRRRSDRLTPVIRKLVVVLVSGGAIVLDRFLGGGSSWAESLTLGLLVGIVSSVVESQLSLRDDIHESRDDILEIQRLVQTEVGNVSRLNNLRDRVHAEYNDRFLVQQVLEHEWERFEERLDSLAGGSLKSKGFETLITVAAQDPRCTSLYGVTTLSAPERASAYGWWTSGAGTYYQRLNGDLARRGGLVERIWVYRDPADLTHPEVVQLLDNHAAQGILCWVYEWRKDPFVPNFTIWNEETAWEAILNLDGQMIGGRFIASADQTRLLLGTWDRLKRDAHPWVPSETTLDTSVRAVWLPSLVNPAAPRVAELTTGTAVANRDITGPIPLRRLVLDDADLPKGVDLAVSADCPVQGSGWLVLRRDVQERQPWAAGQYVEVLHLSSSKRAGDDATTATVLLEHAQGAYVARVAE